MIRCTTMSGSVYEIDTEGRRLRRATAGKMSATKRATEEWREYTDVYGPQLGECLEIFWGRGRDEVSNDLGTPEDVDPYRSTITTPVCAIEEVSDA